jgi:hypothetical protein
VDLDGWLRGLRTAEAAGARRRTRWTAEQLAEGATFTGLLIDLAERRCEVVIETVARRCALVLRGVGLDFCAGVDRDRWVLIPLGAVAAVRTRPPAEPAGSDRRPPLDATLAEALTDLLDDRPRLTVTLVSGEQVAGELHGVGTDVVTLRGDETPPRWVHVALARVADIVIR